MKIPLVGAEFFGGGQTDMTKLNTKYNYQSKHNKNYCIMFYNMFYNYMFRPFSLGHLQVVYTRPCMHKA